MRIITGTAKGLKLKTPKGLETRPTADRIKESVFNTLNGLIDFNEVGRVLDIFAGTGALGLESISRGANSAVFIDFATVDLIFCDPPYKKNLAALAIQMVADLSLLTEKGLMVVEYGADEVLVSQGLNCIREINYGHTTNINIYTKGSKL